MSEPLRIGLLLYPGCLPAGLFAFADLVHGANRRSGTRLFSTRFLSHGSREIAGAHGALVQAGGNLATSEVDAVLVPGFWAESGRDVEAALAEHAGLIQALARKCRTRQLWSYCTGVCLAAATGRLDGQRATATWWMAEAMRKRHGKIMWEFERDCVVGDRVMTATGTSGHLPIAQSLIERRLDADAFRDLANLMVLPRPSPSHGAFDATSLIEQPSDCLRELHRQTERLPAERITATHLARLLGMSSRTLARRVADETGTTLAAYVRRIKLRQASERLILTDEPASVISAELGFSSESNMRRAFKAVTGMTPGTYRSRYGRT